MASSGTFQNTFRTGYALRVGWAINSQNIEANTSNVTVTAYLVSTGSAYNINSSAEKTVTLTIDGTTYSKTARGLANLTGGQTKALFSQTVTITHTSDGSRSIPLSATFGIEVTLSGTYWGTVRAPASGTSSAVLDTIPRATTPTTIGTFNVGNTVTINLPRASGSFTHTVQYSLNNSSWTNIATGVGTSTTWTLPEALASAKTNASSSTVYIRAITYNSGTQVGTKSISRTYNITSAYAAPTVSVARAQTNEANIAQYIRGVSTVTLSATGTFEYGASAAKYVFTYGGVSKTVTTASASASVTFTLPASAAASYAYSVTVTDTRGYTDSASGTVATIAYSAPVLTSFVVTRGEMVEGAFAEDSKGNVLRIVAAGTITSLSNANAKNYKIEYRLNSATSYTTLVNTTAASDYAVSVTYYSQSIFSENSAFVLRFTLSDSFGTVSQIVDVPSQRVLMNFSANGKAMALGGIASVDDALEIMMELYPTGGIKPQELAGTTDFNEIVKTGLYIGSMNLDDYTNSPMATGSFLLEVKHAGNSGQIMQRYTYCHKDTYRAFVRFYYSSAWGGWQPAEGFTAFAGSAYSGRVRLANGLLLQWGRVSITPSAANTATSMSITFPLTYSYLPNVQVSAQTSAPQIVSVGVTPGTGGATIYLTRGNTTATGILWFAIGISA